MDDRDELPGLEAEMDIGELAKQFFGGDLGRYILGVADQEQKELILKLIEAPADKAEEVRQLQNEIIRRRMAVQWLAEAINRGDAAYQRYLQIKNPD